VLEDSGPGSGERGGVGGGDAVGVWQVDGGDEFSGEDKGVDENMSSRVSPSKRAVRSAGSSLDCREIGERGTLGLASVSVTVGWSAAASPATKLLRETGERAGDYLCCICHVQVGPWALRKREGVDYRGTTFTTKMGYLHSNQSLYTNSEAVQSES
jgi:hypothetical protein